MSSQKERLEKLEKGYVEQKNDVEALLKVVEELERERAIEKEVERVISNEKSGAFKYFIELFKLIAILITLAVGGDKAIESHPWITEIFK